MKPSEVVDKVLTDVLVDESCWNRERASWRDPETGKTTYCIVGSLSKARDLMGLELSSTDSVFKMVRQQIRAIEGCESCIGAWNGKHTFPEVIQLLEKTRAALQEAGE